MTERVDLGTYPTDKSPAYVANYEREFGHLMDDPIKFLELGIQDGGSMLLWLDLMPKATIAGLDLNPALVDDDSGRLHIYQGFQQDVEVLDRMAAEVAPDGFDVIVDDASHVGEYTEASFWHLFLNHLKPGGIYVIDDWSCAYWDTWTDGHRYEGQTAYIGTPVNGGIPNPGTKAGPGEKAKRRVRAMARPVARSLPAGARANLEKAYMKAEGATMQTRWPSHDYGLAGFVKQLIDATAVDAIRGTSHRDLLGERVQVIDSIRVTNAQAFIHKRAD